MKKNLSHIINVMFIPILFVFAIWFVKGYFELISDNTNLSEFGIIPLDMKKYLNIFTFPFIHADFSHLLNNTYPIIILGWYYFICLQRNFKSCFLFVLYIKWNNILVYWEIQRQCNWGKWNCLCFGFFCFG